MAAFVSELGSVSRAQSRVGQRLLSTALRETSAQPVGPAGGDHGAGWNTVQGEGGRAEARAFTLVLVPPRLRHLTPTAAYRGAVHVDKRGDRLGSAARLDTRGLLPFWGRAWGAIFRSLVRVSWAATEPRVSPSSVGLGEPAVGGGL